MKIPMEFHNRVGEKIDFTYHPGTHQDRLVILAHGVTGDKDRPMLRALADGLSQSGWSCMRISFSGNGQSGGRFVDSCISKGVNDLLDILDALPPEVQVGYVGHSMGAASGVIASSRDSRIRVLVSLAGMTHTAEFVDREFGGEIPGSGTMWEDDSCPLSQNYVDDLHGIGNTLGAAASVKVPWLLIHGDQDDVVPIQDGLDAFAAGTGAKAKEWVPIAGAGHSFDEGTYPVLTEHIKHWLERHLPC